jgi:hypothetical protein
MMFFPPSSRELIMQINTEADKLTTGTGLQAR